MRSVALGCNRDQVTVLAPIFGKVLREIPLQLNLLITLGSGRVPETEQEVAVRELDNLFIPPSDKNWPTFCRVPITDQSKPRL